MRRYINRTYVYRRGSGSRSGREKKSEENNGNTENTERKGPPGKIKKQEKLKNPPDLLCTRYSPTSTATDNAEVRAYIPFDIENSKIFEGPARRNDLNQ